MVEKKPRRPNGKKDRQNRRVLREIAQADFAAQQAATPPGRIKPDLTSRDMD